jgi:preprotein translocase subunit SecA
VETRQGAGRSGNPAKAAAQDAAKRTGKKKKR